MTCKNCVYYDECFFSGNICKSYKSEESKINHKELEERGESGFYELPRVSFTVLDF